MRKNLMLTVTLAWLAAAGSQVIAATHYVVPPGTSGTIPMDPYTNWATAGTNLIEVVNAAMTNTAARLVLVAAGTYYPTNTIQFSAGLRIESVDGRDATILDGTYAGGNRGIFFETDAYYANPGLKQEIVGLTIRNYTITDKNGAGIIGIGARRFDVLIEDCAFLNNRALATPGISVYGGGVFLHLSRPVVTDVKARITNCVFIANEAFTAGSALRVYATYGQVEVTDSIFENNTNSVGGGALSFRTIADTNHLPAAITRCQFRNNLSGHQGGGLAYSAYAFNMVISSCQFENNNARYYASWSGARQGGGIFSDARDVTIRDCQFTGNQGNQGAGIYALRATIINCMVTSNSAVTNAGGVYTETGTILNSTIAGNSAGVAAGGLFINGAGAATNTIIYYNTAPDDPNYRHASGDTGLTYCDVSPPVTGDGNIDADPLFVDLSGGDLRLRPQSPCINAGINQDWMTGALDLDGNPRVRQRIVDMGAFEILRGGTIFVVR